MFIYIIIIDFILLFYAGCCKLFYFGIYKHHGGKIVNHLFAKLIVLYKPCLKISHIQKWYQNDKI
jgi:hypothetical protein